MSDAEDEPKTVTIEHGNRAIAKLVEAHLNMAATCALALRHSSEQGSREDFVEWAGKIYDANAS